MKIPKVISKNNHEYILVKQCNENLFQYKDLMYGYYECFTKFDLDLIEKRKAPRKMSPENVIFLQEVQMNREKIKEFKNRQCNKCKNRNSQKCEIHQDLNGELKCVDKEEEKNEY